MLYCIIGRTGTGKDYLAKKLEERGLRVLKSYTTRPMRVENEDTHIFITPEEAKDYTDRVAQIKINGYEYFATREQAKNSDVYIIDPVAFDELSANMPETALSIIYLSSDKLDRKCHAVSRAANPIKEEEIFSKRNKDESKMFSDFEKLINNMT